VSGRSITNTGVTEGTARKKYNMPKTVTMIILDHSLSKNGAMRANYSTTEIFTKED
jgi:hypothetical protein